MSTQDNVNRTIRHRPSFNVWPNLNVNEFRNEIPHTKFQPLSGILSCFLPRERPADSAFAAVHVTAHDKLVPHSIILLACRTGVIFLRFSGERGQERGEWEVRDMRDGRGAKKITPYANHCSCYSAPRHTLKSPTNYSVCATAVLPFNLVPRVSPLPAPWSERREEEKNSGGTKSPKQ